MLSDRKTKKKHVREFIFPRVARRLGKENGNLVTPTFEIRTYIYPSIYPFYYYYSILFHYLNLLLPRGAEGMPG